MMYKVCVYAICKNEEQFVDRWMDSMSEADIIVVTDTGSSDGTVERLRSRGALVFTEKIDPWRFDHARNISLDHVPEDTDICVCTDLDEVFNKGWREKLERAWATAEGPKSGRYLYNWSVRPDGSPGVQFVYFKVHDRRGFTWKYPVHEVLDYIGKEPLRRVFIDGMILSHYPDDTKPRSQYLPLLEMGAREMPDDSRMAFYLGREYMYNRKWVECIRELERYISISFWDEEKSAAMRFIAAAYAALGDDGLCFSWYLRGVAEAPLVRDSYVDMAKRMSEVGEWGLVYFLVSEALKIKNRSNNYINSEAAWDGTPETLLEASIQAIKS